jgi:hypothetical protein
VRTFDVPRVAERAIRMKHVEEAVATPDRVLTTFDEAATEKPGRWVVRMLERRGAQVHLNTTMDSAENGHVVLSDGMTFDSELIVWTAGNAATRPLRGREPKNYLHHSFGSIPTWDRKVRVSSIWLTAFFSGRDIVSLTSVQTPQEAFQTEATANSVSSAGSQQCRTGCVRRRW